MSTKQLEVTIRQRMAEAETFGIASEQLLFTYVELALRRRMLSTARIYARNLPTWNSLPSTGWLGSKPAC